MVEYIKRSVKQCTHLEVITITVRELEDQHLYVLYVQDTQTGRSWIILRVLEEFLQLHRAIKTDDKARVSAKFPSRFKLWFQPCARELKAYLNALLHQSMIWGRTRKHVVAFFKGTKTKHRASIPQTHLAPQKRILITKCGALDTIQEDSLS